MYTECPECQTAFRLTVQVLRKARGRVRCGGCGQVFDALEHLHDEAPAGHSPSVDETSAGDRFERQSQALLESLDQLAGSEEVRIEDTGLEWRVYDTEDDSGAAESPVDDDDGAAAAAAPVNDAPQGPDFDTEVPATSDAAGTSDDVAAGADEFPAVAEIDLDLAVRDPDTGDIAAPEWQSDTYSVDETVDDDAADAAITEANEPAADAMQPGAADTTPPVADADQAGAATAAEAAQEPDVAATATTAGDDADELRFDDNTPLPDEMLAQVERESLPEADEPPPEPVAESAEPQADLSLGDPDDWATLLDEMGGAGGDEPAPAGPPPAGPEAAPADAAAAGGDTNLAAVSDTEDTGIHDPADEPTIAGQYAATFAELARTPEAAAPAEAGNDDAGAAQDDEPEMRFTLEEDAGEPGVAADDRAPPAPADERPGDAAEPHGAGTPAPDDAIAAADEARPATASAALEATAGDTAARQAAAEAELEAALDEAQGDVPGEAPGDTDESPEDELERSMNIQIDQELMDALAEQATSSFEAPDEARSNSGGPLFETIIMEGESVRVSEETVEEAAAAAADRQRIEIAPLEPEVAEEQPSRRGRIAVAAIAAVLCLALAGQVVHAFREQLATHAFFRHTLGPVYGALGAPVVPAWNARGWQFESTNGSTDAGNRVLTIYSRIANKTDVALPYPLVHVSLTDRFEDVIGSRVVTADEYLAGTGNPQTPVEAGRTFTAVIAIDSPATDATGFKLNVCYRVVADRLRCAVEAFRD